MGPWIRRGRRLLSSNRPLECPFAHHTHAFHAAELMVRLYFALVIYIVQMVDWERWAAAEGLQPLWPVAWTNLTTPEIGTYIVVGWTLLGAILAVVFPRWMPIRIFAFLGILQLAALSNSFGKINHGFHVVVAAAFWFALLPSAGSCTKRVDRQRFLMIFWAGMASMMFFYSISGFWKLAVACYQLALGEVNAFSPEALAYHIARRGMQTNFFKPAGRFLVEHSWLGWPLYLGTLYLEFFAIVAAFRPRLLRFWGLGLMMFHTSTRIVMGIGFFNNALLLAVLVVGSPFGPQQLRLTHAFADLPLVAGLLKFFKRQ